MTTQAKRLRDLVRAAGFNLNEFRVRTERQMYKGKFAGWGHAEAYFPANTREDSKKLMDCAEALVEQGLVVRLYVTTNASGAEYAWAYATEVYASHSNTPQLKIVYYGADYSIRTEVRK